MIPTAETVDALTGPYFHVDKNGQPSRRLDLHPMTPLCEVQEKTFALWHIGVDCPNCMRLVRLLPTPLNSQVALCLAWMCKRHVERGGGWIHMPTEAPRWAISHMKYGLLHWWDLAVSPDRGVSGMWAVRPRGLEFWTGKLAVLPKYAHLYNDTCFGYSPEGVSIADAMGDRFDYHEMLRLSAAEFDMCAGEILDKIKREKAAKKRAA
jgi:hypothetical protein